MKRPRIALVWIAIAAMAPGAAAQDALALRPGVRVRLHARSVDEIPGVVSYSASGVVDGHPSPCRIPRGSIETLEIETRKGSRTQGALIGLAVGAGTGAAIGFAAGCDTCIPDKGGTAFFGGVVLGAIGLVIGLASGHEGHFEKVPPEHFQVSLRALRQGVGVQAALAF
jgi:hypothetical protein